MMIGAEFNPIPVIKYILARRPFNKKSPFPGRKGHIQTVITNTTFNGHSAMLWPDILN
jgi:hypothetical protein